MFDVSYIRGRVEEIGLFGKFFKPNIEKMVRNRDVEGLIRALEHKDSDVRHRAREALCMMGDPRAVGPILQDVTEARARYIVAKLAKIGDPAVEPLTQALKDEDITVRAVAQLTLDSIEEEKIDKMEENRDVDGLIKALKHKHKATRRAAARALERLGDSRAVEPLIQALKDEEWDVRRVAAEALGKMGDARASKPLSQALSVEKELVTRGAMWEAITKIKHVQEGQRLRPAAKIVTCPHCGGRNETGEWRAAGNVVPYYCQEEPGNYSIKMHCPHCDKDWYVVWDSDPGPVIQLT